MPCSWQAAACSDDVVFGAARRAVAQADRIPVAAAAVLLRQRRAAGEQQRGQQGDRHGGFHHAPRRRAVDLRRPTACTAGAESRLKRWPRRRAGPTGGAARRAAARRFYNSRPSSRLMATTAARGGRSSPSGQWLRGSCQRAAFARMLDGEEQRASVGRELAAADLAADGPAGELLAAGRAAGRSVGHDEAAIVRDGPVVAVRDDPQPALRIDAEIVRGTAIGLSSRGIRDSRAK